MSGDSVKTVPVLRLSGTHYEMGLQYGKFLRDRLKTALSRVKVIKLSLLSLFPFFLRPFVGAWLSLRAAWAEKKIPGIYLDELRGVSKGSGLPLSEILFASTIAETLIGFGCTSVINSVKGRVLHSRNLDFFPPFLGNFPVVLNCRPAGKIPYTLVGFIGYLPGLTGMNEKGVTLSLNESSCAFPVRGPKKKTLAGYALRTILEEAENLNDAESVLRDHPPSQGWTLTAGSEADRGGAVFDIACGLIRRNGVRPGSSIYAVNTFVCDEFTKKYQCVTRAGHSINHARKKRLDESFRSVRDTKDAIRLLSDTGMGPYGDVVGDSTVNNYRTLQTVVMDPSRKTIVFSSATAYAARSKFYRYDIAKDRLTVYREARPLKAEGFVRWMDKLYGHPPSVVSLILGQKETVPFQLEALFFLKDTLKLGVPWKEVLFRTERLLEKHPGHPQLTRWKGEILYRMKEYPAAAVALETALRFPGLSPNDRMYAHYFLAESMKTLGDGKASSAHARASLKLIGGYAAGPAEKKLTVRLKTMLRSIRISGR